VRNHNNMYIQYCCIVHTSSNRHLTIVHITSVKTNLTHNICFVIYIYYVCYLPVHVSSSNMLIIRSLNCINTASVAVTLCRWPFGAQVGRVLS
jgi:hypothetical protein